MKKAIVIMFALMFNVIVGGLIANAAGLPPGWVIGAGTALSVIPASQPGMLMMGIQKEIWINDIVGNLFKANPFIQNSMNHDQFVLAGKVVHIPQAGAKPNVVKNRSSLPATVIKRTDVDITYAIDEYTSDPILIPAADQVELSYDKRASVLAESQSAIDETCGDEVLYNWAPTIASQYIRTSGGAVDAHLDSATSTRKKFTAKDLKAAAKLMNTQNIPKADRYCIMDSEMIDQLKDDLTATQYKDFSSYYDAANGVLGKLEGFVIYERSYVLRYTNASTPVVVPPDALGDSAHNAAVLCWQKNSVAKAMGDHDIFENVGDPVYYGDIYSVLLRLGSRKHRSDQKGIVAIIQAHT
jgi:hypothetical protein